MTNTSLKIASVCDSIKDLLIEKNEKYGDSALNPVRIFSKASNVEQLLVRIDDKLSRISRGAGLVASDEDVVQDLIGYLVLLKIALKDEAPSLSWNDVAQFFDQQSDSSLDFSEVDYSNSFGVRCPD